MCVSIVGDGEEEASSSSSSSSPSPSSSSSSSPTFYTCKFCEQTFTHLSAIMHHTLKSKFLKVKSHIFL